jgi:peptidoglycan/LPS O-acetylase OafA/YrhL
MSAEPAAPIIRGNSEIFPALNGLRFLAALAVVIFHYAPRVAGYAGIPAFVKNTVNEGPAAVGFFFILSGFVLAHRHLYGARRSQSSGEFYWSRFVRLYPAYLLAFLLFLPVAVQRFWLNPATRAAGPHTFVISAVLSLLMVQSWTPLAQAWNGPSWSLSVEAFLYLMFPLMAVRFSRLSRKAAAAVMCVSWLFPSASAFGYVSGWIPASIWQNYITNNPLLWLPLFVAGICASRWIENWKGIDERKAALVSSLTFFALVFVTLTWPYRWADLFVTGAIAPLLAATMVSFTRPAPWIARTIGSRAFSKLGDASYVVYILQAPLWHYWQPFTNYLRSVPMQTAKVPFWQFAGYLPFLILVSLCVQRFIEAPVRTWLNTWRKGNQSRPVERFTAEIEPQPS